MDMGQKKKKKSEKAMAEVLIERSTDTDMWVWEGKPRRKSSMCRAVPCCSSLLLQTALKHSGCAVPEC